MHGEEEEEAMNMEQQQLQQQQHPTAEQLPPAPASSGHGRSRRRRVSSTHEYMPQELVDHIMRRSSLWAATRLQLVSRSWAAAGRAAAASHHHTPWMFLYTIDTATWSTTGCMASIRGDGGFFRLKKLAGSVFIGSCGGWLAFKEYTSRRLFLLNPFTMARIDPPPLPIALQGTFFQNDIYLYPTGAAAAGGCCMVASFNGILAVWEPGHDEWKWVGFDGWDMMGVRISLAAVDGKYFYVLDLESGVVYVLDVASPAMAPLEAPGLPLAGGARGGLRLLAKSHGELLLVHCDRAGLKGVHRLDTERREWVELGSLGRDRALFVGPSPVFGVPLTVAVERAAGCRGDHVYLLTPGTGLMWTEFDMAAGGMAEKMEPLPPATAGLEGMFRGVWVSPMLG